MTDRRAPATTPYALGIDLGTSGCKACVIDRAGRVLAEGAAPYPILSPQPLWAEQNPQDWLPAVASATKRAIALIGKSERTRIRAIALTSAAHIGVLLDHADRPIRNAILWNDQRSSPQVKSLERRAGKRILNETFQAVSTTWTLPHLAWVRENEPKRFARVRRLMLSKDYLLHWMTGESVTDPGTAVSSQLWDVNAGRWSESLCRLVGLSPEQLPQVRAATDIAGPLLPAAAKAMGLPSGLPVIVGTLDSATEMQAAGLTKVGQSMVRLATAGGLQWIVRAPSRDRHRITYPHPVQPRWYCQAGTNTCAAAVEWAKRLIFPDGDVSFEEWDKLAASAPAGSDGLVFRPHLAGERAPYWNPDLRASFTGLTLGHSRAHLARAVYEGTAFSILDAMRVMPPAIRNSREPISVVGGGTRSAVWLEILANVLNRPLRVMPDASSARGAALLALASLLHQGHLTAAAPPDARVIRPNRSLVRLYARQARAYLAGPR